MDKVDYEDKLKELGLKEDSTFNEAMNTWLNEFTVKTYYYEHPDIIIEVPYSGPPYPFSAKNKINGDIKVFEGDQFYWNDLNEN